MSSTDPPVLASSSNRLAYRNTYIYNAEDRETALGGLYATGELTYSNLYSLVRIICVFDSKFHLEDETGTVMRCDQYEITPGKYYIVTTGTLRLTKRLPLFPQKPEEVGIRDPAFRGAVRLRDLRCVITGASPVVDGVAFFESFESAHIFPIKHYGYWEEHKLGDWITIPPASESYGTINSVQNGMLLTRDMHCCLILFRYRSIQMYA
ncbi:hypothetical protein B9Z19DRAFT_1151983 [Tuber borchii]|uniref:Uncharacterized protein n=1 Tax=Tuber borchii TaxID=42251 RepID=A0A2T6ZK50_TUBBO|nr:hypothetical protein B9Z19DRAFT_1151983 [Tuber borchii]